MFSILFKEQKYQLSLVIANSAFPTAHPTPWTQLFQCPPAHWPHQINTGLLNVWFSPIDLSWDGTEGQCSSYPPAMEGHKVYRKNGMKCRRWSFLVFTHFLDFPSQLFVVELVIFTVNNHYSWRWHEWWVYNLVHCTRTRYAFFLQLLRTSVWFIFILLHFLISLLFAGCGKGCMFMAVLSLGQNSDCRAGFSEDT